MNARIHYPSIFNDVIGPVMRGPSSSHCAASVRIGRLARALMNDRIEKVLIEFDPNGSLATTHASQGSDMGLFGGLLGWDAADERLPGSDRAIQEAGTGVEIRVASIGATHPNTYKLTLSNRDESHEMIALSTGGGMIEVTRIDGATVSLAGDSFVTLVFFEGPSEAVHQYVRERADADSIAAHPLLHGGIVVIRTRKPLEDALVLRIQSQPGVRFIRVLPPVLPVMTPPDVRVPFLTCDAMLRYNQDRDLPLWKLAALYECARGELEEAQVLEKMRELIRVMRGSIELGLQGTEYRDRILGCQSKHLQARMKEGKLLGGELVNRMLLNVTAIMEVKSSMGVIVAAPTAGACAALPGGCIAVGDSLGASEEDLARAMLAAGMIGIFIAAHATFAAEVGGCQAEGGSASGMAAAAFVTLAGGSTRQAIGAASMALQNCMGMVCDPVANRVEVPCLGRNLIAAMNALSSANVAIADFDPVIPLDEVIDSLHRVGRAMPCELRCTGLGGLAITKTSKEIEARLDTHRNG